MSEKKKLLPYSTIRTIGLVLILGILTTIGMVHITFPDIPGEWETNINLDNLTRMVVPGAKEMMFPKKGAYAIYYEYRSVLNSMRYENDLHPPSLECALTSKTSGETIHAVPDYVETNSYSTKDQERVGVLIMSITIHDPGKYTLSCQYPDGRTQPEIILAVGPNIFWEILKLFGAVGLSFLGGTVVLFFTVLIAMVFAVLVIINHIQTRKKSDA